jgi:arylformamidase
MPRLIDLSHPLAPGMPCYPGLPQPRFHVFLSRADAARAGHYAPGTTFQIATYEIAGNTGTYLDAPFHRHEDAADLAHLPLERLANLPGLVIDAPDGAIDVEAFKRVSGSGLAGRAMLVRTGWSRRWGSDGYFRSGPHLTAAASQLLADAGVALVGIDCANIDHMADPARPAHTLLLAAGIPIVEHLRGLDQLPAAGFRFFAVPPAIQDGTSFPVRAFAILEAA